MVLTETDGTKLENTGMSPGSILNPPADGLRRTAFAKERAKLAINDDIAGGASDNGEAAGNIWGIEAAASALPTGSLGTNW
ncbi:hypothetical protein SN13T_0828 [Lactiplantibacillus plantarum]|nr:hypothetical protein SN13T_0828 [Lactiplantibacillus plantarum]